MKKKDKNSTTNQKVVEPHKLNCIIKMKSTCKRYVNHQNIEMIASKETAIEFCNRNPDYYYIEVEEDA